MARSISDIQSGMLKQVSTDPILSTQLTSTSKRAIFSLYTFIIASAIAFFEQLLDIKVAMMETAATEAPVLNTAWLKSKVMLFQYSTTVPQIIQFVNLAANYPIIDPTLCIISRVSITTTISNQCLIKVATGEPPTALNSNQLASLQAYVNVLGIDGIKYVVTSTNPDQLYLQAQIFYNGQYSSVISNTVIAAINVYLANIPFNGVLKISDLESNIKAVAGVTDVIFQNIQARADSTVFGAGLPLVQSNTLLSRLWQTLGGDIIAETTANQTLLDSLTFIPDNQ